VYSCGKKLRFNSQSELSRSSMDTGLWKMVRGFQYDLENGKQISPSYCTHKRLGNVKVNLGLSFTYVAHLLSSDIICTTEALWHVAVLGARSRISKYTWIPTWILAQDTHLA
jgi:hypothetical protein